MTEFTPHAAGNAGNAYLTRNYRDRKCIQYQKNSFARLLNYKITNENTPLNPLYGRDQQLIPSFPATSAHIHALNAATIYQPASIGFRFAVVRKGDI
ncbi:uncharacterized protein LAJ45_07883 [Morchella importuna]|uniref:uncharacterized protein n=1 Tax=Morchella importuna TaxID=1174673 RepID=UPI001E8EAEAD|nr:uncharacterized protein LAJ45_07883 [Morchella importuna]KAH8148119.1 hypothetical protein LAJ45_07883 [Morchella importuna]